jgi:hypothetical protein
MKKYQYNGVGGGYTEFLTGGKSENGSPKTIGFFYEKAYNPILKRFEAFGIFVVNEEKGEDKYVENDPRFKNGTIQEFKGWLGADHVINPLGLSAEQIDVIEKAKKVDPECLKLMVENIMQIANDRAPSGETESSGETKSKPKKEK